MASTTQDSISTVADDLFDKYLLPKVALTTILVASLLGTAVTGRLTGEVGAAVVVGKWAYFVSLGVLTGGLVWKHGFVKPGDLDTGAAAYCGRMYERFDRLSLGATVVLLVAATAVVARYWTTLHRPLLVGGLAVVLLGLGSLVAVDAIRPGSVADRFRSPAGVAALGLALLAVALTATLEVRLEAGGPVAVGVRIVHLLAFSVWIGGAVWNIFVAVPTGKENATVPIVLAAGEQLERFRWAVRFIIPTLLVTGAYQAVSALGTTPTVYLVAPIGLAVLAKVGLIGALVVIFKLCPMWRACSPIDGVCDIDDLDADVFDDVAPATGGIGEGIADD